jgi:hypothetical protein
MHRSIRICCGRHPGRDSHRKLPGSDPAYDQLMIQDLRQAMLLPELLKHTNEARRATGGVDLDVLLIRSITGRPSTDLLEDARR